MIFGKKSLTAACDNLTSAIERRDEAGYGKALQAIANAIPSARREDVDAALDVLTPLLERLPIGIGSPLAGMVGNMVEYGANDPMTVLPTLVERACAAMEDAARFDALHRSAVGETPSPEDQLAVGATIARVSAVATDHGSSEQEVVRLAEAWFAGGDWVQPVLYLCQRKDVRLVLPQRQRLAEAIEAVRESIETAHWLHGLLQVIDDAALTVLHRATGRGYLITISGIGDNFQLHTLLAANLIGNEAAGLLPGTPPTATMVAAATDGDPTPDGHIIGQFNLVDGNGAWIWNEGCPADIPILRGERLVVLDPQPYERSWNAGRAYPLMRPEFVVRRHLSPAEAADRLTWVKADQRG